MSGSQRLSSALCIGFLYSTANGFAPTIPSSAMIESQNTIIARRDARSQMPSGTTNLRATKGRSSAPTTAIASSSDKVKEMASFLSYQILEKVMADAMKPEGERTMDLEAVERITQALQTTSPTSDLPPDVTMTTIPPESTSDSKSADDSAAVTTAKEPEATLDPIAYAATAIPETTPEDSTAAPESETTESNKVESSATAVEEEKPVVPAPAPATEVPEPVWTPLEVVQSNIPPLRPESIPKRTNPAPVEEETETIQEEVVAETPAEEEAPEDISDEEPPSEDIVAEEPDIVEESPEDEALILESKKAQEAFQRRLLQQKLEYDTKAASRIESQDDSEPPTPVEDAEETTEKDEDTTKGESTAMNEIVSDPCESSESESPAELTTQRSSSSSSSPPVISQRRVETILARRQPKSTDEESILTEKYAEMENLEDRAYALLVDLGMIDEHKDPKDPLYDHSDDDDLCEQRYFPRM